MRKIALSMVVSFCTVGLMAQTGSSNLDVAFNDSRVEMAYKNYLQLKDALVASKADAAKEAAGKLKTSLGTVKAGNPDHYQHVMIEATKIANASTLEEIRKSFASLSTAMKVVVKEADLAKGVVYVEYCPMANNNTGAYWLSNEKEIRNPYFGDKMLKCGSVKETLH